MDPVTAAIMGTVVGIIIGAVSVFFAAQYFVQHHIDLWHRDTTDEHAEPFTSPDPTVDDIDIPPFLRRQAGDPPSL